MKNSSGRKRESGGTFGKKNYSKSDSGEKRSYNSEASKHSDNEGSEGGEKKRRFNKPLAKREGDERKIFIEKKEDGKAKRYYSKDREEKTNYGDKDSYSEKKSYSRDSSERKPYGDREKRSYSKEGDDKKSYGDREKKSYSRDNSERKPYGDREKRSYSKEGDDKKSYGDREKKSYSRDSSERKPYGDREKRSYSKEGDNKKSYGDREKKSYSKDNSERKPYGDREKRSYSKEGDDKKSYKKEGKKFDNESYFSKEKAKSSEKWNESAFEKSKTGKHIKPEGEEGFIKDVTKKEAKPYKGSFYDKQAKGAKKSDFASEERDFDQKKKRLDDEPSSKKFESHEQFDSYERKSSRPKRQRIEKASLSLPKQTEDGLIRLNKYIANSGVCSRREADKLIESGAVSVNGKVVSELGYKVKYEDEVHYGGTPIKRERHVYVLLNKPKDYITTLDDPEGRKTVMELIKNACKERVYPVGRLDRNTTGLLLFTNDGDMTMKLTHPKNNIQKLYSVEVDKSIKPEDFKAILDGMELEDGFIKADSLEFVGEGSNRREVGIEIHSGRNRIVRRMFEHLGYKVVRLDRVMFAGLTKKDLPRSKWRFLSDKEIGYLKMLK